MPGEMGTRESSACESVPDLEDRRALYISGKGKSWTR